MKLDILTNDELLKLATHQKEFNEHIDREWRARFFLSFPYQLSGCSNKIYNILLATELEFDECDKKILEQANMIRKGKNEESTAV